MIYPTTNISYKWIQNNICYFLLLLGCKTVKFPTSTFKPTNSPAPLAKLATFSGKILDNKFRTLLWNSIYASIKPVPKNTQVYLGGIKMGSKVQKLNISNNMLSYAIKNPTKGETTTITYYADKDGKLPLNTTIITCM